MQIGDLTVAALFGLIYGIRLLYQAMLLRRRDTSGTHGDQSELLLVIIPKNLLVVLTLYLLARGVHWNALFFGGWAVFLAGIVLRIVALHDLGPMYSLNVDLRVRHRLITQGAYSLVRHPLYVAYVLDTVGIVLFLQQWWFVPILAVIVVGWALRIPKEERALEQLFGDDYRSYRQRVPAINLVGPLLRKLARSMTQKRMSSLAARISTHAGALPARIGDRSVLSDAEKAEIEIHLAEYRALSDFQRDAKATFVRIAIYHNTGIVVVVTWLLQNAGNKEGVVALLIKNGFFFPVLFALPILNSVLMIASAYQAYSFFCVALHFAHMRRRLEELVGAEVFAYEDKFARLVGSQRQLSLFLDVLAAIMWFTVPVLLAGAVAVAGPRADGAFSTTLSRCAYGAGIASSLTALGYLLGLIVLMRQVAQRDQAEGAAQDRAARSKT
jgi:protein-S-isoprenylcysteine O-methyltransferase Ste14